MEITQILGYIGALLIGIVLGLIGGGGSILTVPVLVYLLHINPVTATAYSLFVVGASALVGALRNISKGLVDFRTAIVFAIPAFISVYLTRRFLVPAIPEEIFTVGNFILTKNLGIMVFFAIIMLVASISMIKNKKESLEPALGSQRNDETPDAAQQPSRELRVFQCKSRDDSEARCDLHLAPCVAWSLWRGLGARGQSSLALGRRLA